MALRKKIITLACVMSSNSYTLAADLNARDFYSAPSGTQVGLVYLNDDRSTHFHGKGANNAKLRASSVAYRHVFFTDICDTLCTPQFILPAVDLKLELPGADKSKRNRGFADLQFGGTLFIINQPEKRLFSGVLTMVTAPTGSYQSHNAATSIGKNRWQVDFVYNITKGITDHLIAETNFEIQLYSKNNDFNGMSYRQRPLFRNQTFISYDFTPQTYGALRFIFAEGGSAKLAGNTLPDSRYRNVQLGLELGHKISPKDTLMLSVSRDVQTRNTFQGSHLLLRLAHVY